MNLIVKSSIDMDYYQAVMDGKFVLLDDLARYLGQKRDNEFCGVRYIWQSCDNSLTVYVNEMAHYLLVAYQGKAVASTESLSPKFIPGPWWETIELLRPQIEVAKECYEEAKSYFEKDLHTQYRNSLIESNEQLPANGVLSVAVVDRVSSPT